MAPVRLEIRVQPGSVRDTLRWDPWRGQWTVACRAPAVQGAANRAVLGLMAIWLRLPTQAVRWASAGRSRFKSVEVEGLSATEVHRRLTAASAAVGDPQE